MSFADDRVKALSLAVATSLGINQLTSGDGVQGFEDVRPGRIP